MSHCLCDEAVIFIVCDEGVRLIVLLFGCVERSFDVVGRLWGLREEGRDWLVAFVIVSLLMFAHCWLKRRNF